MRHRGLIFTLFALLVSFRGIVYSQAVNGSLLRTIMDASGAAVRMRHSLTSACPANQGSEGRRGTQTSVADQKNNRVRQVSRGSDHRLQLSHISNRPNATKRLLQHFSRVQEFDVEL